MMKTKAIPWVYTLFTPCEKTRKTEAKAAALFRQRDSYCRLNSKLLPSLRITLATTVLFFSIALVSGCKDPKEPSEVCLDGDCLLDFSAIDSEAAWSPDGQWIAFHHIDSSAAKAGIWLIRPDGTGARLWRRGAAYPAWSPDGQWIAFEERGQVLKQKVNGDSLTQLTFEGGNFFPTWSPDGKKIAFDSNTKSAFYAIQTMDIDGQNKSLIGYDPTVGDSRQPHWNKTNMIVHYRHPGTTSSDIFIMDSKGENLKRITSDEKTDREPKLSPNGNLIVFSSQDDAPDTKEKGPGIFIVDVSGANVKKLTHPGVTANWSPDGKTIVYTKSSAANGRLWLMAPDGSDQRQLTFPHQFN